jgi:archaellum component FlaC
MSTQPIDLTGGLVPKGGAPPSAPIDLSGGLVPAPALPKTPQPSMLDTANQYYASNPNEGVGTRVGKSLGRTALMIPNILRAATAGPTDEEKTHGYNSVYDRALSLPFKHTIVDPSRQAYGHIQDIVKQTEQQQGHPLTNTQQAVRGAEEGISMIPVVGPFVLSEAEQAHKGDIAGTVADVAAMHVLPKIAEEASPGGRLPGAPASGEPALPVTQAATRALTTRAPQAIRTIARQAYAIKNPEVLTAQESATKALKPRNSKVNWNQELGNALPDVRRALDESGTPVHAATLDDVEAAALAAKRGVWNEYSQNFSKPNEGAAVDTTPVAGEIRKTVSDRMIEQSPQLTDRINQIADTYSGRRLNLGDIETRVQELNNETRAIEARYPTDKAAAKASPDNAYVFAERNALRNLLISKMDELSGPGAQDLRTRYGALNSFQDVLQRRKAVYERQSPESLGEQVGGMIGVGQMTRGAGRIIGGDILGGGADIAAGYATRRAAKVARQMNDSQFLMRQALRKTTARPSAVIRPQATPPSQIGGLRGVLPAGRYPQPASTAPPQPMLEHMQPVEGEYVQPQTPPIKRLLPPGRYEQPGGFEPNQPSLPEKGTAIQLPEQTPKRPVNTVRMPQSPTAKPKAEPAPEPSVIANPPRVAQSSAEAGGSGTVAGAKADSDFFAQAKAEEAAGKLAPGMSTLRRAQELKDQAQAAEGEQSRPFARQESSTTYGEQNQVVSKAEADQARANLRSKMFRSNVGLDPTMLADAAKLGAYHLEAGLREFTAWSQKMIQELGEQIRPHLDDIWDKIRPNAPTFFSKAERVINEKVPNNAPGDSVLATLRNAGVKEDEIKWTGLDDFLRGKAKVSKAELQQYIRDNQIQLKEVNRGENPFGFLRPSDEVIARHQHEWDAIIQGLNKVRERLDHLDNVGYGENRQKYTELLRQHSEMVTMRDNLHDQMLAETHGQMHTGPSKFEAYTLPGAKKNYTEKLLTLPYEKKGLVMREGESAVDALNRSHAEHPAPFKSPHFDEPNILAHVRYDDRTDAGGNKVLFIEEVQSDWHQKGKKIGYRDQRPPTENEIELKFVHPDPGSDPNIYPGYWESYDKRDGEMITRHPGRMTEPQAMKEALQYGVYKSQEGVPDAPFKSDWHELVMKRMLREAAEKGYDKLAWVTGDQTAERYDLSKHVDSIDWMKHKDGTYGVAATKDGREVVHKLGLKDQQLDELVGKDIANKVRAGEGTSGKLKGLDLKVGGQWAQALYDRAIPNFLRKYGKRWGATVGETNIQTEMGPMQREFIGPDRSLATITSDLNRLKDSIYRGQVREIMDDMKRGVPFREAMAASGSPGLAEQFNGHFRTSREQAIEPVHSIDITPAMKKSVLKEGQPIARQNVPSLEATA